MIVKDSTIAIITVTYSPGKYLEDFLSSVEAATRRKVMVVMADNGSTDGAPEAAADVYDWVHLLRTGGNIGYGAAINRAVEFLSEARKDGSIESRYFVVANPDVVFSPGSIDELINTAETWGHEGDISSAPVGSVGPYIREPDGSAYPSARAVPTLGMGIGHALLGAVWKNNPWSRTYRSDSDMTKAHTAGWLSGSCLMLDWEAWDQVGGFDERYFMYMEDVDLGDRLGRAGYCNVFQPRAVITHAKGHAAGKEPARLLPAHHESAYRFQADRYPRWYHAPVRLMLKTGLAVRQKIAIMAARRPNLSRFLG